MKKNLNYPEINNDCIFNVSLTGRPKYSDFRKVYDEKFNSTSTSSNKGKFYYVWIALNSEGMVVVVGKTSFSKKQRNYFGDLFKDYPLFPAITQEILFHIVTDRIINSDKNNPALDSLNPNIIEQIKLINAKVNQEITSAIIVPIDKKPETNVSNLEKTIGDILLNNQILILNGDSHKR